MTLYLRKMMQVYLQKVPTSKQKKFYVGVLKVKDENSRIHWSETRIRGSACENVTEPQDSRYQYLTNALVESVCCDPLLPLLLLPGLVKGERGSPTAQQHLLLEHLLLAQPLSSKSPGRSVVVFPDCFRLGGS
jgi:hypothetical protein